MNGVIRKLALAATLVGGVALAQSTTSPTPPPPGSSTSTDSQGGYHPGSDPMRSGSGSTPKTERSTPSGTTESGYGGSGDAGTGAPMKKGKKPEASGATSGTDSSTGGK